MSEPQAEIIPKPRMVSVGALMDALEAGKKARKQGFGRVTPYYEKPALDKFWFGGYDGKTFGECCE